MLRSRSLKIGRVLRVFGGGREVSTLEARALAKSFSESGDMASLGSLCAIVGRSFGARVSESRQRRLKRGGTVREALSEPIREFACEWFREVLPMLERRLPEQAVSVQWATPSRSGRVLQGPRLVRFPLGANRIPVQLSEDLRASTVRAVQEECMDHLMGGPDGITAPALAMLWMSLLECLADSGVKLLGSSGYGLDVYFEGGEEYFEGGGGIVSGETPKKYPPKKYPPKTYMSPLLSVRGLGLGCGISGAMVENLVALSLRVDDVRGVGILSRLLREAGETRLASMARGAARGAQRGLKVPFTAAFVSELEKQTGMRASSKALRSVLSACARDGKSAPALAAIEGFREELGEQEVLLLVRCLAADRNVSGDNALKVIHDLIFGASSHKVYQFFGASSQKVNQDESFGASSQNIVSTSQTTPSSDLWAEVVHSLVRQDVSPTLALNAVLAGLATRCEEDYDAGVGVLEDVAGRVGAWSSLWGGMSEFGLADLSAPVIRPDAASAGILASAWYRRLQRDSSFADETASFARSLPTVVHGEPSSLLMGMVVNLLVLSDASLDAAAVLLPTVQAPWLTPWRSPSHFRPPPSLRLYTSILSSIARKPPQHSLFLTRRLLLDAADNGIAADDTMAKAATRSAGVEADLDLVPLLPFPDLALHSSWEHTRSQLFEDIALYCSNHIHCRPSSRTHPQAFSSKIPAWQLGPEPLQPHDQSTPSPTPYLFRDDGILHILSDPPTQIQIASPQTIHSALQTLHVAHTIYCPAQPSPNPLHLVQNAPPSTHPIILRASLVLCSNQNTTISSEDLLQATSIATTVPQGLVLDILFATKAQPHDAAKSCVQAFWPKLDHSTANRLLDQSITTDEFLLSHPKKY